MELDVIAVCISYAHAYVHMTMHTHLQKHEYLK